MSWWPRSLIARILLAEAAAIAVAALLLPLLLVSVLQRTTQDYQGRLLLDQARGIARGLAADAGGRWRVTLPPPLHDAYASSYDGRAYAVVDGAGRLLAGSRFATRAPWGRAPREAGGHGFRVDPYAGVSLPLTRAGPWVVVTQDESGPGAIVDDIIDVFQPRFSAVMLVVLLVVPLVNSLLIRRLVLSVRQVSAEALRIGPANLHARLDAAGLPSEVAPLATATNSLLDRLERSFHEQGQFVANVAHELRTPLSALRLRVGMVEDAGVRQGIDRQVERLSHVISQLRDLGGLEDGAPDRNSRFALGALAHEVVGERLADRAAHAHPIALIVPDDPVEVVANRTLVQMAMVNLLDNALRHTPAGTSIRVVVGLDASLSVEDDGPGLTAGGTELAGRRFWRADHKRSDSAGLGLSIVQRIMAAHGGRLEIGNREPRGAVVTLRFPGPASTTV